MNTSEVIELPAPVKDELIDFLKSIQEFMNWHYELESLLLNPISNQWNEQ